MDVDKRRMIIALILRLVFSLTSLIDASEFFEVSLYLSFSNASFSRFKHLPFVNNACIYSFVRISFFGMFLTLELTLLAP